MSAPSDGSLIIQLGQLWWVDIPFNDSSTEVKRRPAVIVGWSSFSKNDDQVILVVPITSHGGGGRPRTGQIEIPDPVRYSLDPGSHIRARNIVSIHPKLLTKRDGPIDTLDNVVMNQVLITISELFNVQGVAKAR